MAEPYEIPVPRPPTTQQAAVLDPYLDGVRERLAADGHTLSEHDFGYGTAMVGSLKARRWSGPMELTTIVLPCRDVTPTHLDRFVGDAALNAGIWHGGVMASGLAVVIIMATTDVTAEGREAALGRRPGKHGLGGFRNPGYFAWPAVADVGTSEALFYTGSFALGRLGSGWVRQKMELALGPLRIPPPI